MRKDTDIKTPVKLTPEANARASALAVASSILAGAPTVQPSNIRPPRYGH